MLNLPFIKSKYRIHPTVLVVLDGFGLAPPSDGNAITKAHKPNFDFLVQNYPNSKLIASGESVGLPANEVGNTEVGHLTLGAGRIVLQDLKRINLAIENGSFYDNKALIQVANHIKKNNSKLHILGLASSGNVHSSLEHLYALLQFCKKEELHQVYLHVFTDGRDAPRNEGVEIIASLEQRLKLMKVGSISTICGRYYAMDRDRRWNRTEKAYRAIIEGVGMKSPSAVEAIKAQYAKGLTDEFIEPVIISDPDGNPNLIQDNDAVVFFNYRIDRPKQLTMAIVLTNFEGIKSFDFGYISETGKNVGKIDIGQTFKRDKVLRNLFFVTMTEYDKHLPVSAVAYPPEALDHTISKVIENSGLMQLHMSESEKERFVTYYFNGMREEKLRGEDEMIVPSPKVATYDLKPEMSLSKLVGEFCRQINKDKYAFAVVNFANPDMVAHTGNLNATIKSIEAVDKYLLNLVDCVLKHDGTVFITADHGNAEELITYPNTNYFFTSDKGTVNTDHSNNPVPLIIVSNSLKQSKMNLRDGSLADVAPTVISAMGLQIPKEMTGSNLFSASGVSN